MSTANTKDGSFVGDMRSLFESGEGADVTLVVGASQLPAHSFILSVRSPVFAAMLRNNMKEASSRQIEFTDVQEDVLRQLLCFMYTDTAPQLASMAAELFAAADKYDLPLLKKMCEEKMVQNLSVDNAAAYAVLAVVHSCPMLENATVDFIGSHPEAMISDGWLNVLRGTPEIAAHICSRVVEATTKKLQKNRTSSVEQTLDLAKKLTEAAKAGSVREVETLLAAGAPVDARDSSGFTALHLAVMKASTQKFVMFTHQNVAVSTIKCLLKAGANVNAKDSSQQTPLHAAANRGDVKIMWELLTASAEVDARDRWGKTPLHWAAAANNGEAVRTLLLAGARKNIMDDKGVSPQCTPTKSIREIFEKY